MTTPMPRCSCGCGAVLTEDEVMHYYFNPQEGWVSMACLALRRAAQRKSKPKDGEAEAVKRGLVPAPRRKRGGR
jgi:hypothetical protein